jgi:hypothetical protein
MGFAEWYWRGCLAACCQAGVFTQMGDHPDSDVQLPGVQFLNFTLSSATLNQEFPQYNYAEQGDLVGYFAYNPAELIIWAPRATGQLDQDPPSGALVQLTGPILSFQTLQIAVIAPPAPPVLQAIVNYSPQNLTLPQSPPPPPVLTAPPAGLQAQVSVAVPEPSLNWLVGMAIVLAAAMRSSKLLRR